MNTPGIVPNKHSLFLHIPALVLLAVVLVLEYFIVQQTGRVMYPIDDPYIHLAMARHFAEHGVFGVSLAGFSASSSSPLWTLLLGSLFKITGNHESLPAVLNMIFGVASISLFTRMLANRLQSIPAAVIAGTLLVFVLPMPTLVILGMEHTLHIFFMLLLTERVSRIFESPHDRKGTGIILLLVFLSMMTRFETMFVAAPLTALCLLERRWSAATALVAGCAAPLLILGAINIHNGWLFFPASIELKSALSEGGWERVTTLLERLNGQLFGAPHMTVPFVAGLAAMGAAFKKESIIRPQSVWLITFVVAMVLHCSMALIGWYYRYEGYLLAIGFMALAPAIREFVLGIWGRINQSNRTSERWIIRLSLAGIILLLPFPFYNHGQSIQKLVSGARNIHSQQYQMGLFLKKYYEGEAVLANDIGAINYLTDIYCLDVAGLGSIEPLRAKAQGLWNPRFLHSWCAQHKVTVVMAYDSWLNKIRPPFWIKVGEWMVDEKVSVADSTVSFYALTPQDAQRLRTNLKAFEPQLPEGVTVKIHKEV